MRAGPLAVQRETGKRQIVFGVDQRRPAGTDHARSERGATPRGHGRVRGRKRSGQVRLRGHDRNKRFAR